MIELIPDIVQILFPLAIGLVAFFLYTKNRKFGLALIWVAFFLSAVPSIVNLALGGPYLALRLMEQGYTPVEMAEFYFFLFLLRSAIQIAFAVLVIVGLVKISTEAK